VKPSQGLAPDFCSWLGFLVASASSPLQVGATCQCLSIGPTLHRILTEFCVAGNWYDWFCGYPPDSGCAIPQCCTPMHRAYSR